MAVEPEWRHRDGFTFKLIKIRCNSICWGRLRTFNYILTASPHPLRGDVSTTLPPVVPSLSRGPRAWALGVIQASSVFEADITAVERGLTPGWRWAPADLSQAGAGPVGGPSPWRCMV